MIITDLDSNDKATDIGAVMIVRIYLIVHIHYLLIILWR